MNKKEVIPITVRGLGMIPRIGTLAPMLVPKNVELQDLDVIVQTRGMYAEYYDDRAKRVVRITGENYKKIFQAHQNKVNPKKPIPPIQPPKRVGGPKQQPVQKPVEKPPEKKEPEAPKVFPFAFTIGEGDTKISTGVTIEDLSSGKVKGKSDWWIQQGADVVPIPLEWVEELTPSTEEQSSVTPDDTGTTGTDGVSENSSGNDMTFSPIGAGEHANNPKSSKKDKYRNKNS